ISLFYKRAKAFGVGHKLFLIFAAYFNIDGSSLRRPAFVFTNRNLRSGIAFKFFADFFQYVAGTDSLTILKLGELNGDTTFVGCLRRRTSLRWIACTFSDLRNDRFNDER